MDGGWVDRDRIETETEIETGMVKDVSRFRVNERWVSGLNTTKSLRPTFD